MIKLTKEQIERKKELEREEELQAGDDYLFEEHDEYDNEEEEYYGYNEYNKYYDEPDPYDDYEQELKDNEEDDDPGGDFDDTEFLKEQEAEQKQEEEELEKQIKFEREQRAIIAFEKEDGSIISSTVEKWGSQFGSHLIEHYNDEKSALKVSEVGSIDPKEDCLELPQTMKKLIQKKNKNKRTQELKVFNNFDEYDKYIKDTRDIDCAYLWRNKSWEFLEWIFEYDQNDFGIDITKDEYFPRLVLSSSTLKKEKNKSKFIKYFTSWSSGNRESISEQFMEFDPNWLENESYDDLPF